MLITDHIDFMYFGHVMWSTQHLVKGLEYALLNKVRSEIDKKPYVGE